MERITVTVAESASTLVDTKAVDIKPVDTKAVDTGPLPNAIEAWRGISSVEASRGANLFAIIRGKGLSMETPCAGKGTCGKCKVRVLRGEVSPPTPEEERFLSASDVAGGIRLACRTWVNGDVWVEVSDGNTAVPTAQKASRHRILETARQPEVALEPAIRKVRFDLPLASFHDSAPAIDRLAQAVPLPVAPESQLSILRQLGQLEAEGTSVTAVLASGEVIAVEPGDTTARSYGLAIDIGTTTVVTSLVDLIAGKEITTASDLNPQKAFGLDVLSRIEYAQTGPDELTRLRDNIVNCLNDLAAEVCRVASIDPASIYEACVAGNSTMMHLLLGVNPRSIGAAPYSTIFSSGQDLAAADVGLSISPVGRVYCLPSVSGYVGADITAGILATEMHQEKDTALLVDIGTNGEIALTSGGKLVACASPAGPALEGMNISCGMRAAAGAIEQIIVEPPEVHYKTIGDQPPVGICGSGIIDMVAELLKAGIVEPSGRMISKQKLVDSGQDFLAGRLTERGTKRDFLLIPTDQEPALGSPASLACGGTPATSAHDGTPESAHDGTPDSAPSGFYATQQDIRQVQLAKGAITAGITALLKEAGISEEKVHKVYIAGAFGTHVRLESLSRLGIIPAVWADRVTFVGNSAKAGALMCLLSQSKRREAEEIGRTTRYFELSLRPGFGRLFSQSLRFPAGV